MSLTDSAIRNAKPQLQPIKLYDGGGLFIIIAPSGSKLWRLKYRFNGIEKALTFGRYPEVTLKEAREKRDEARKLLDSDVDPGVERRRKKLESAITAANTFKIVCDEFLDLQERDGRSKSTMVKNHWLAKQLLADLARRPISEIEPFEILTILKRVERRGNHETAKRLSEFASRVFQHAIITSRTKTNPAAHLSNVLVSPKVKHHAAIVEPIGFGKLLRDIETAEGFMTSRLALKIAPHLFVRPGELRKAEWSEFDFEQKIWRIPAGKMKQRVEHTVPLGTAKPVTSSAFGFAPSTFGFVFAFGRAGVTPIARLSANSLRKSLRP